MTQQERYESIISSVQERDAIYQEAIELKSKLSPELAQLNDLRSRTATKARDIESHCRKLLQDTEDDLKTIISKLRTSRKTMALDKMDYLSPEVHAVCNSNGHMLSWFAVLYTDRAAKSSNPYVSPEIAYWGLDTQVRRDWLKNRANVNKEIYPSFFHDLKSGILSVTYYDGYYTCLLNESGPRKIQPSGFKQLRVVTYDAIATALDLTNTQLVDIMDTMRNPYNNYQLGQVI